MKKNILWVDDDKIFRSELSQSLKLEGIDVTQAAYGKLAQDICQSLFKNKISNSEEDLKNYDTKLH